jgi:hypothetical protein
MMVVSADVVSVAKSDLLLTTFLPTEQICAAEPLTDADLRLIADLRGDLADEQGRLTAYWNYLLQGYIALPEPEKTHLALRLSALIERLVRLVLDAQHFAFTQIGTTLEVVGWVERTMTGLSDARAILSPQLARNDTSLVTGPPQEQEVA